MRFVLICLLEFNIFFNVDAQNYNFVPNPSFEEYYHCPGDKELHLIFSNLSDCKDWYNPSHASPDYYNKCATDFLYSVPHNYNGNQNARTGNAYVGIVFDFFGKNLEYIAVKLKKPLSANSNYCLKMYLNLAKNKMDYCINEIHYALTNKKIESRNSLILDVPTFQRIINTDFFENKTDWIEVCSIYHSKGDEEYLTIGIFDDKLKFKYIGKDKKKLNSIVDICPTSVYYYIDDVSLTEIRDSSECSCIQKKDIVKPIEPKANIDTVQYDKLNFIQAKIKPIVLKNVFFETGKSTLLPTSYEELDLLDTFLKENNSYKIEINGYTDNVGNEEDNLKLSEARARAVSDYLKSKNISAERITFKGYGSKNPISNNDNSVSRRQNRRVEFRLLK